MLDYGSTLYYSDITAFEKAVTSNGYKSKDKITTTETTTLSDADGKIINVEQTTITTDRPREIDGSKFELLRTMLEVLIDLEDDGDTTLGAERALAKTSFSYKLAFNTLYNYGILKEKE